MLLKDQLVDNLSEIEWQRFVVKVINSFLTKPVEYQCTEVSELYSQIRVMMLLDLISIPNGEIMAYLAKKLDIKLNSNVTMLQRSGWKLKTQEQQKEEIFSLASLIILIQNGYQKIPIKQKDHNSITHKVALTIILGVLLL